MKKTIVFLAFIIVGNMFSAEESGNSQVAKFACYESFLQEAYGVYSSTQIYSDEERQKEIVKVVESRADYTSVFFQSLGYLHETDVLVMPLDVIMVHILVFIKNRNIEKASFLRLVYSAFYNKYKGTDNWQKMTSLSADNKSLQKAVQFANYENNLEASIISWCYKRQ